MATPSITLYCYPPFSPDWQLPTVHPHSLAIHAYLQMCPEGGAPFTINYHNPHQTSTLFGPTTNELPSLSINNDAAVNGIQDILTRLHTVGYKLTVDETLSDTQRAETAAFSALVQDRLYKCQLYDWWIEEPNYERFIKQAFFGHLTWPMRWWIPRTKKKQIEEQLHLEGFRDSKMVEKEAARIYKALSVRLGDNLFFYGDEPSTLDCIVFGFLQTQTFSQIPKSKLATLLCSHQNLVEFCRRVIETWYTPGTGERKKDQRPNYKPLEEYTKTQKAKYAMVPLERQSSFMILVGLFGLFAYTAIYNSYFHQWYYESNE